MRGAVSTRPRPDRDRAGREGAMFAGSRLNRQRTVTDLYGVRAILPAFSTEYQ